MNFSYIRLFAKVFTYQSPFQLHVKGSGALRAKLEVRRRMKMKQRWALESNNHIQIPFLLFVNTSETQF